MKKNIFMIVMTIMVFMALPINAQESVSRTLNVSKQVKADRNHPLTKQYEGFCTYYIHLNLPDIDKVPQAYKKALTAVRDTVISKATGIQYQKGDKDYQKLIALFETKMLDNLEEMIAFMDESERDRYKPLFQWLVEYSGQLNESVSANPMVSDIPFFQFFLEKTEFIGNSWYKVCNLVFDCHTGQLLTIEDLLNMTEANENAITELMRKEFRTRHPQGTDYDYHVYPSASFEISELGINFYIPTDEVTENQLEYVFVDRDALKPYVKKGSLLDKYWK